MSTPHEDRSLGSPQALDEIARVAHSVRARVLHAAMQPAGGYLTQACGVAEILATLYVELMDLGPVAAPKVPGPFPGVPVSGKPGTWGGLYHGIADPARDRFIVSPAHYALAVYATLVAVGRLAEDALATYARDGSVLEMIGAEHSPGIEVTSGSLGQALSVAIGRALVRQRRGDHGRIWVLLSDGELQEGQTWEALQVAAHYRLDNLTVVIDVNGFQVDGPMAAIVGVEPVVAKLLAFGWSASEIDGHDPRALIAAAREPGRAAPRAIVCRTIPWQGIPSLEARFPKRLHYIRFVPGEAEEAVANLEGTISAPV